MTLPRRHPVTLRGWKSGLGETLMARVTSAVVDRYRPAALYRSAGLGAAP